MGARRQPGQLEVALVVDELDVEEEEVDEGGEASERLAGGEAAGVDGGVDPRGPAGLEERRAGTRPGRAARRPRTVTPPPDSS